MMCIHQLVFINRLHLFKILGQYWLSFMFKNNFSVCYSRLCRDALNMQLLMLDFLQSVYRTSFIVQMRGFLQAVGLFIVWVLDFVYILGVGLRL